MGNLGRYLGKWVIVAVLAGPACGSGPNAGAGDDVGGTGGLTGEGGASIDQGATGGAVGQAGAGGEATPGAGGLGAGGAGPPLSEYRGFWEGTTSQSLPVSFHVTAGGSVPDLLIRLRLSLATGTCTATLLGDVASLLGAGFTTVARVPGISVTPTVGGTFSSPTAATGTYTGQSGGFTVLCGSSLTFGTGSILSAGTFTVSRVSTCGNSAVEKGEECDSATNCDVNCQRVPVCGDGFVDAPETCDDSNAVAGDGCSAACKKEARVLAFPGGLPATGQSVAGDDSVIYQITGVTPGTAYAVSTRNATNDVDIYVYDDAALTRQLCRAITLSGNETCTATPTGDALYVVIDNFSAVTASFTLDVAAAVVPVDGGLGAADAGGSQ